MRIEFQEGSAVAHPNFERYMDQSAADGALPLRFDCAATSAASIEEIAAAASRQFEDRAREEQADIVESTVVATQTVEASGQRRFRVLAIARHRKPIVDRVIERVESL